MFVGDQRQRAERRGVGPEGAPVMISPRRARSGQHGRAARTFGRFADTYRVLVFDARARVRARERAVHPRAVGRRRRRPARVGRGRAVVMAGGSYGGFISMEYAIRYPERRSRWSCVTPRPTPPTRSRPGQRPRHARSARPGEVRADHGRDRCATTRTCATAGPRSSRSTTTSTTPRGGPEVETPYRYDPQLRVHAEHALYDLKDRLGAVTCPTLVTVGRGDWITPVPCSERIVELDPQLAARRVREVRSLPAGRGGREVPGHGPRLPAEARTRPRPETPDRDSRSPTWTNWTGASSPRCKRTAEPAGPNRRPSGSSFRDRHPAGATVLAGVVRRGRSPGITHRSRRPVRPRIPCRPAPRWTSRGCSLIERNPLRFLCLVTGANDLVAEIAIPKSDAASLRASSTRFRPSKGVETCRTDLVLHQYKVSQHWLQGVLARQRAGGRHPPRWRSTCATPRTSPTLIARSSRY